MPENTTRNETDRLEQWFDFTQKLYSTLDLEDASKIALAVALRFTGLQRGMLYTYEKDRQFKLRCAQNAAGRSVKKEQLPSAYSPSADGQSPQALCLEVRA